MNYNHVHTYKRNNKHKNWYFCIKPDCFHRMDKGWLEGKRAACPICQSEFILSKNDLRLALPKCQSCRGGKKAEAYRAALSALSTIINPKTEETLNETRDIPAET